MSVKGGYSYFAICTPDDRFGEVVEGVEPMFEETTTVADSFESFLEQKL